MKLTLILLLVFILVGGCATIEDFIDEAKEEIKQDIKDKVNEVLE